MIPVKILTREQAIKLGLAEDKPQGKSGGAELMGYSTLVTVNGTTKETVVDEQSKQSNGIKEITFMSKERKKYLKDTGSYINYIKGFDKIEGKEVSEEIKAFEESQ